MVGPRATARSGTVAGVVGLFLRRFRVYGSCSGAGSSISDCTGEDTPTGCLLPEPFRWEAACVLHNLARRENYAFAA